MAEQINYTNKERSGKNRFKMALNKVPKKSHGRKVKPIAGNRLE